jgi:uncharacterized protein YcsI (UPF0317 family)
LFNSVYAAANDESPEIRAVLVNEGEATGNAARDRRGEALSPATLRSRIRDGSWPGHTSGASLGYVQANLVILPAAAATSFRDFCAANPQPLPVLEITEPGIADALRTAPGADLRTDVSKYFVYRSGKLAETPSDITALWQDDFVAFLLGCSFTAEDHLIAAGVGVPHLAAGRNVAMFSTNIACTPVGGWHGPLVVSMRPIDNDELDTAVQVTSRLPLAHGAPVHVGDPAYLGIDSLAKPDWGDVTLPSSDQTPVFWACGVTPQAVIKATAPELAITHAPGHMFVTDLLAADVLDRGSILLDPLHQLVPRN